MMNTNSKSNSQMKTKRDNLIKKLVKFFVDASEAMLKDDTQTWYFPVPAENGVRIH